MKTLDTEQALAKLDKLAADIAALKEKALATDDGEYAAYVLTQSDLARAVVLASRDVLDVLPKFNAVPRTKKAAGG